MSAAMPLTAKYYGAKIDSMKYFLIKRNWSI